jgi:hypothetical protein
MVDAIQPFVQPFLNARFQSWSVGKAKRQTDLQRYESLKLYF